MERGSYAITWCECAAPIYAMWLTVSMYENNVVREILEISEFIFVFTMFLFPIH